MHKSSYLKMEWFKNVYLNASDHLEILDVGSFDGGENYNYRNIFNEENWNYTGLDFEAGNNVDIVVADIYNWFEIEDNSYDVIISGQFFEHLEFFWLTMAQIERVLKPGGFVCIIAPSDGPKHGGSLNNCYKFYEDGFRALAKYVNLEVIHVSVDETENSKPWHDTCLVAHKSSSILSHDTQELEMRINALESKLDVILSKIKSNK